VLDAAAALGVTPALPLDRVAGDGGSDDVPAGATVLVPDGEGIAAVTARLEVEADVDWYQVEAATPGRHDVFVGAPNSSAGTLVEVRDAQGRLLGWCSGSATPGA
jgi:hypothetical protein